MSDIYTRVQAILTQANNAATPEESEVFTLKATELIAKYNIDSALVAAMTEPQENTAIEKIIVITGSFVKPKFFLLGGIARAMGCRAIYSQEESGKTSDYWVHTIGYGRDISATRILYTSLLLQGTNEALVEKMLGNSDKAFQTSLWYGFATRIGQRLEETTKKVAEEKKSEEVRTPNTSPGTALMLATREIAVRDAVSKRFPRLKKTKGSATSLNGYNSGVDAANRANLHNNPSVNSQKALSS